MAQEKWEYMTEFVWANIAGQGVKEELKKRWPNFKSEKYSPETMIPTLNSRGEAGWELVSMQPVCVQKDHEILFASGGVGTWTNIYFCAFKRRINE